MSKRAGIAQRSTERSASASAVRPGDVQRGPMRRTFDDPVGHVCGPPHGLQERRILRHVPRVELAVGTTRSPLRKYMHASVRAQRRPRALARCRTHHLDEVRQVSVRCGQPLPVLQRAPHKGNGREGGRRQGRGGAVHAGSTCIVSNGSSAAPARIRAVGSSATVPAPGACDRCGVVRVLSVAVCHVA